jgi:GT2 family glycosyltransferase
MRPLVSIISLNWNRRDDLRRTLENIREQTYEPKEIIVVDNGSTDGSSETMRKDFPEVHLISLPSNLGVEGYNIGMKRATGEYLFLIDNDMDLLQKDTLEKVVSYFENSPKLGSVALQVRDKTRITLSHNNPKFWEERGDEDRGFPCSAFDGGGVAFRRKVLDIVGHYLPEFFIYHSEVELSTRIWDAGFEVRYFPGVAVSHRESGISRDDKMQTYYATRNYLWYVWLYYPLRPAFYESFHFLQRSFIQNYRRKKSLRAWFKGVCAAIFHWPSLIKRREPARQETIEWMQFLRDKDRERKAREANQKSPHS